MGEGEGGQEEGHEAVTTPCCVRCGKAVPYLAHIHHDPYCSVECAKAAHGVEDQWQGDPRRHKPEAGETRDQHAGFNRLLDSIKGVR